MGGRGEKASPEEKAISDSEVSSCRCHTPPPRPWAHGSHGSPPANQPSPHMACPGCIWQPNPTPILFLPMQFTRPETLLFSLSLQPNSTLNTSFRKPSQAFPPSFSLQPPAWTLFGIPSSALVSQDWHPQWPRSSLTL